MSAFRFRYTQAGGHIHVRVFAGDGLETTLGKCGDLVFRNEEWQSFREVLRASDRVGALWPEVAVEIVPDEDDNGMPPFCVCAPSEWVIAPGPVCDTFFGDLAGNCACCDHRLRCHMNKETGKRSCGLPGGCDVECKNDGPCLREAAAKEDARIAELTKQRDAAVAGEQGVFQDYLRVCRRLAAITLKDDVDRDRRVKQELLEANNKLVADLADLRALILPKGHGTSKVKVLADVAAERERQDAKWGGATNDDQWNCLDWHEMIADYNAWARRMATMGSPDKARVRYVQIAALAVAAVEALDRKGQRT